MTITEPTLLLNERICRNNISAMCAKAKLHRVAFRPHFKTHQSRIIGGWFREAGATAITVSSLKMAHYFSDDGWNDITVAFPVNVLETDRIRALSSKISLNLLVVNRETVPLLDRQLEHPVGIFLKIDAGYHRTGIQSTDHEEIEKIIGLISRSRHLRLKGFLTHAGNTYHARSREEILAIHKATCRTVAELRSEFSKQFPELIASIGDTPGCSVADDFGGIDEMRPGNFVFYDTMQLQLGSCTPDDVAVAMACPVVATHPDRNQAIIYGGAVHFSKDFMMNGSVQSFGSVVELQERGWSAPIEGEYISSLSQEHGVVTLMHDDLRRIKVGTVLGILPVHSCLTADCMKGYVTLDGVKIDHMSGTR